MTTTANSATAAPPANWLEAYAPPAGRYDELKMPDGQVRPVWQKLAASLAGLSQPEQARRSEQLRHLIQENGITYNVYGNVSDTTRPWGMDLLPMLLEWPAWERIQAALAQRAHLFNLILQDLYGSQKLLTQRILPPALVLGNASFLRPCHGYVPPDEVFLPLYGADLARAPDGQWWVLADRLDAPSGIGYALENRFLTTRVLSDWFRDHRVARLGGFFQVLRESFEQLAYRRTDNPSIVLLTPGPANETFFEHSFLARNLGFPAVEGGDLAVRNERVFLKTISGMQPVDVILRRVDSDYCDPVELRSDSVLGVPGLLQALRAGHVTLANSLGAAVVESAGISPFLPALCRHLLGEDLKMPSVAAWWCGQPREMNYVLEHLDSLILHPAVTSPAGESVKGPLLSAAEREHWRQRITAEPAAWCAREWVALATTPTFEENKLVPCLFQMRALLVAKGREYHAMPGGLTRIPAEADDLTVSMQRGGRSKDTWVMLPPEVPLVPDIGSSLQAPVELRRHGAELPSRVADNLFWLGRYLERAEGEGRVLRLLAGVLTEEGAATTLATVRPFYETLALVGKEPAPAAVETAPADFPAMESNLRALLWDVNRHNSLAANIARLEATAYRVKERLSADSWTLIARLREMRRPASTDKLALDEMLGELNRVITRLAAVSGLMMENMTRGHGWKFLDLGRRIERGGYVAALLKNALAGRDAASPTLLHNLLVCCDSLITYRRRYLTNIQIVPVFDLLALEEANPRSLIFQLNIVREHVETLPRPAGDDPAGRLPERLALSLFSQTRLAGVQELLLEELDGSRPVLGKFIDAILRDLATLSDALGQVYFAHGAPPKVKT